MSSEDKNRLTAPLAIPFQHILTAFQIGNPNIYTLIPQLEKDDTLIHITDRTLTMLESPVAGHFSNSDKLVDVRCHMLADSAGQFLSALTYKHKKFDNSLTNHFTLMVGKLAANAENPQHLESVSPHYVLTGQVENNTFYPLDSACLILDDNKETVHYIKPKEEETFYASICYADAAFRTLLSGAEFSIEANQSWIEGSGAETKDRFNFLGSRSAEDLSQEIVKNQYIPANISLMTPSPLMQ